MKAQLIRIGNSQGIRLPKPLIEQAGLGDDLELRVADGKIIISGTKSPRQGWSEAAAAMAKRGDDKLLDKSTPTHFDKDEWNW